MIIIGLWERVIGSQCQWTFTCFITWYTILKMWVRLHDIMFSLEISFFYCMPCKTRCVLSNATVNPQHPPHTILQWHLWAACFHCSLPSYGNMLSAALLIGD